jgi:hypothetical protein
MALSTDELKEATNQQKDERRATSPRPSSPEAERETKALGESAHPCCQVLHGTNPDGLGYFTAYFLRPVNWQKIRKRKSGLFRK